MFIFTKCRTAEGLEFKGLFEVCPQVFADSRGTFLETYSERAFFEAGIAERFVQDNRSQSERGVLRGLHFQKRYAQGKLVRAEAGRIYDVVVDLRAPSETRGQYYSVVLDAGRQNMLYIPKGFAHGFYALTDGAVFTYKCTAFYHPEDEGGIIWNDPALAIDWGFEPGSTPALSAKDSALPLFNPDASYFDTNGVWVGE